MQHLIFTLRQKQALTIDRLSHKASAAAVWDAVGREEMILVQ